MKRYIIVGWDEESKKMLYYGDGLWWQFISGAQIFENENELVIPDKNIERIFKMEVNFGKVEEMK